MDLPLISIIIPCYNHGKYLDDCINSVLAYSNHEEIEIILVNDGSDDPFTIQKISTLNNPVLRIINQQNMGLSAARNTGIREARANLIMNLDSDNKITPLFIKAAINFFFSHKEIDILYTDKILFYDNSKKTEKIKVEYFHIRKLLLYNFIDACTVFRKSIWEKVGGFDINTSYFHDWEFWLSCYSHDAKFYHFKKECFYYRVIQNSMIHGAKESELNKEVHYIHSKHINLYSQHIRLIGYSLRYTLKKPLKHLIRVLLGKPFLLSPHN